MSSELERRAEEWVKETTDGDRSPATAFLREGIKLDYLAGAKAEREMLIEKVWARALSFSTRKRIIVEDGREVTYLDLEDLHRILTEAGE